MFSTRSGSDAWNLEVGDVIAIMYQVSRDNGNDGEPAGQWIQAEIIEHEADRWPFARLADGQLTDVRPYMMWRGVACQRSPVAGLGKEERGAPTSQVRMR
jgi:hypothetical protein